MECMHDESETRTRRFYNKYRNYILFNKNIIISGTLAFFAGGMFTQLYAKYDSNDLSNSIATLTVEYGIYIPVFSLLFYIDNKGNYVDPLTGGKDYSRIKSDIKKLLAAFLVSEIIYSFVKFLIHFELLQRSVEPYQASMMAALVAWTVFLVVINVGVKAVRLFRS
jgi:hypothetical protein